MCLDMPFVPCSLQRQSQEQNEQQAAPPSLGRQRAGIVARPGSARLPCKHLPRCKSGRMALSGLQLVSGTFQAQSRLCPQGRLRGEAPLMLEIFAALFKGLQPESLTSQESTGDTQPAHRHSGLQAQRAARPVASRPPAKRGGPRHPRFGGVFTKTLDDGVKQCSLAGAKQSDLLGPVSTVTKAGLSKVCTEEPDPFSLVLSGWALHTLANTSR